MKYVVIGGLSIDNVVNADGETKLDQFGGNAAYGCAGARIWAEGEVGMVARIGKGFPQTWLDAAARAGVNIDGVRKINSEHTLVGGMVYDERGDRDNYIARDDMAGIAGRGARKDMDPLFLHQAQVDFGPDAGDIPHCYDNAEAVLLAPRYLNKQLSCARHYREQGGTPLLILDPMHFYMHLERSDELGDLFSRVDVLLPSEFEVEMLFGKIDPLQGARLLADMGARVVVVKLGGNGCLVYQKNGARTTRTPVVQGVVVRDPTGAGDSFCGGFLVGLNETGDPVEVALYGTVSASFVIEGFGADFTFAVSRLAAEKRLRCLRAGLRQS